MNPTRTLCILIAIAIFTGCHRERRNEWVLPPEFHAGVAGDGQLVEVLDRIRAENNLPALAAVSITSTGIVELAATGVRAVAFPERVSVNDQWHLGSITKPMTATLAARLVEKGLISWDAKIGAAVPELSGTMRVDYQDVTLEDLLRHEAGLPRDVPMEALKSESDRRGLPKDITVWIPTVYDSKLSPTENRLNAAAAVLTQPPIGPKGKSQYSNAGFMIAGLMLERAAGLPFEEVFRRELLVPLGMQSSGFGAPGTPGKRDQPWGHWPIRHWFGSAWCPLDPGSPFADIPPTDAPNGRAHASLQDIARFAAAHLAGVRGKSDLLSAESFRKLQGSDANNVALDWGVGTRDWAWGQWLTHGGSTLRWYATLSLAPNRDFAIFAACNAFGGCGDRGCDQATQVLIRRYDAAEDPRVRTSPASPFPGASLTITYLSGKGPLAGAKQINLHHGINGWKDVVDTPMFASTGEVWELTLDLRPDTRQIDFCFNSGSSWDNHSGWDWHVPIGLARASDDDGRKPVSVGAPELVSMDALLEHSRSAHGLPAIAAVVVRADGKVEISAVGVRQKWNNTPVSPDDRWHLGSNTKACTATLIARLIEQHRLDWSTTVGEILGPTMAIHSGYRDVTIEQLLAHSGGLPHDFRLNTPWKQAVAQEGSIHDQRRALLAAILVEPPAYPPGSKNRYSNTGFVLAGLIAEEITGKTWEELIVEEVVRPLGITTAGFGAPGRPDALTDPWGHRRRFFGLVPVPPGPAADNPPALGPAGTLHMSLADYAKILVENIKGEQGEGKLLSADTYRRLHSDGDRPYYGLGWGVRHDPVWGRVITHTGSNGRWFHVAWASLDRQVTLAIAANAPNTQSTEQAFDEVLQGLKDMLAGHADRRNAP